MNRILAVVATLWLAAGIASAGEKKLMHSFAFTAVESASEADWQSFYKATGALPEKIPGLTRVWYGKLARPMGQIITTKREDYDKLRNAKPGEEVSIPASLLQRQYGVCMEFNDEAALKTYGDHPAHKEWEAVYFKVRQPGTLSFNLLGQ